MQVSVKDCVIVALLAFIFYDFNTKITVLEKAVKIGIRNQVILLEKELNRLVDMQEKLSTRMESMHQEFRSSVRSLEDDQRTRISSLNTEVDTKMRSTMNELQSLREMQNHFVAEMQNLVKTVDTNAKYTDDKMRNLEVEDMDVRQMMREFQEEIRKYADRNPLSLIHI